MIGVVNSGEQVAWARVSLVDKGGQMVEAVEGCRGRSRLVAIYDGRLCGPTRGLPGVYHVG